MSRIRDGRNEPDRRARNRFGPPNRRALPDRSEGRGNRELGSRRNNRHCLRKHCVGIAERSGGASRSLADCGLFLPFLPLLSIQVESFGI
jgi:hypothetical protein